MKMKLILKLGFAATIAVLISSCLDINETDSEHTKVQEQILLGTYIDSLESRGHDVDTVDGVYYVILEEGEGEGKYPETGDTLSVGYSGYLIDGFRFDSSEDGKWEFVLGSSPMIQGWDIGIKQVEEGGKIQFMVPSDLAYGETGQGIIGPYETLIFVVKLFDIKPSE